MRTEKEIREEIKESAKEWKELDDKNSCFAGMIMGKIDALQWVLEDADNE